MNQNTLFYTILVQDSFKYCGIECKSTAKDKLIKRLYFATYFRIAMTTTNCSEGIIFLQNHSI